MGSEMCIRDSYETANVSMLEALACGTPVIATKCGGPESLLDESVSIIIDAGDSQALASALTQMYSSAATKYSTDNNRKFVLDRYSIAAVYAETLQAYQRAIDPVSS